MLQDRQVDEDRQGSGITGELKVYMVRKMVAKGNKIYQSILKKLDFHQKWTI